HTAEINSALYPDAGGIFRHQLPAVPVVRVIPARRARAYLPVRAIYSERYPEERRVGDRLCHCQEIQYSTKKRNVRSYNNQCPHRGLWWFLRIGVSDRKYRIGHWIQLCHNLQTELQGTHNLIGLWRGVRHCSRIQRTDCRGLVCYRSAPHRCDRLSFHTVDCGGRHRRASVNHHTARGCCPYLQPEPGVQLSQCTFLYYPWAAGRGIVIVLRQRLPLCRSQDRKDRWPMDASDSWRSCARLPADSFSAALWRRL